jgi:hypothetical protein
MVGAQQSISADAMAAVWSILHHAIVLPIVERAMSRVTRWEPDGVIDQEKAQEFAADWLAAWNAHDLDAVLSHYADELDFVSPLAVSRLGRADGAITSKSELRDYFSQSLVPGSELRFQLEEVFAGVSGLTLLYRNHRNQRVAETMVFGDAGLVERVCVHHGLD